MRIEPDAEAIEFAVGVRSLLAQHADRPALQVAWDSDSGRIDGLWQRLAETGATGLVIEESLGGVGLDLSATLPLLVEAGRACLPEPLTTTIAGAAILGESSDPTAAKWLQQIANGDITIGLGVGPGSTVFGGGWAELLILKDPRSGDIHLVPADDVTVDPLTVADHGARLARVEWSPSSATVLAGVSADRALDIAAVAAAAELVGVADAMLDMSVEYAKNREQFGQAIGAFQAVKHQLANVYVAISFARPVVARGMWTVATSTAPSSRDASHALHVASTSARLAARTALQVHAGIGYTYEHDLHMWLKRTWTLTSVLGDPAWHRERIADLVLNSGS